METIFPFSFPKRPRRLRSSDAMRRLARETRLSVDNLVAPLFVIEGTGIKTPIEAMPGQFRMSPDVLVEEVRALQALGIPAIALFPAIDEALKDPFAAECLNEEGLYPRTIRAVKEACPDVLIITDVALDPYSSFGHDGLVNQGLIDNDSTLQLLAKMAVLHAQSGADIIAPSDMMDSRVMAIREMLDEEGYTNTAILSYTAKYASAYYGPFREALDSAPRAQEGVPRDKKTYQMDPANAQEALRELHLDIEEGADMVMVKPAINYLDVIHRLASESEVPVAAYHVSGEYAMIKAAVKAGWLDEKEAVLEATIAIRRAGASVILTYFAKDIAMWLSSERH